MTLPKIEYPTFQFYVKSLDRMVKFRPFLVKEEKILLMAKEGKDAEAIRQAIEQIINNCAVEPLEVDKLPMFDIEMIFLKLRAKSVGESVKLVFNCKNEVDGQVCDTNTDYQLNLDKIEYEVPEGHNPKVMITDKLGIKLKYPTLANLPTKEEDEYQLMLDSLIDNIECVFDGEQVYNISDATEQEQIDFIESLSRETMDKIVEFFNTAPKVVLTDKVNCKKCGFEHTLHAENLLDFFI